MTRKTKIVIYVIAAVALLYGVYWYAFHSDFNPNAKYKIGQPLDSLNGVVVYYNGMVGHIGGRNRADDGYNLGMKYQCVEFVKRYYYQRLHHKMPDTYGNAKDFFDAAVSDSAINEKRALLQFTNGSLSKPRAEDLVILDGYAANPYGHVAIVSFVTDSAVGIVQQNPGPFAPSRETFPLECNNTRWIIKQPRLLGWLRKDSMAIAALLAVKR